MGGNWEGLMMEDFLGNTKCQQLIIQYPGCKLESCIFKCGNPYADDTQGPAEGNTG